MTTCSAINCSYKHYRDRGDKKSVYKFPFNRPKLLKKWLQNVNRKNWTPSKDSVLCSDHFEEKCYDTRGSGDQLRVHAVPTLFDFSTNLKEDERYSVTTETITDCVLPSISSSSDKSSLTTEEPQKTFQTRIDTQKVTPSRMESQETLPTTIQTRKTENASFGPVLVLKDFQNISKSQMMYGPLKLVQVMQNNNPNPPIDRTYYDHVYAKSPEELKKSLDEKILECDDLKKQLREANKHIFKLEAKLKSSVKLIKELSNNSIVSLCNDSDNSSIITSAQTFVKVTKSP